MAERRMFAKSIIDSDLFLDMPLTAQALYYHLAMRADDEGFVNNPNKIKRMTGASDDDLRLLTAKMFLISFESGVVVIRHWKLHNYIRKDTFKETLYTAERDRLRTSRSGEYELIPPEETSRSLPCESPVTGSSRSRDEALTQVRSGKVSTGEDSVGEVSIGEASAGEGTSADKPQKRARFIAPTLEEVRQYCRERNSTVDPQRFIDYYTANGWRVGKNPMKDWKASVRTWEKNGYDDRARKEQSREQTGIGSMDDGYVQRWQEMADSFDPWAELERQGAE